MSIQALYDKALGIGTQTLSTLNPSSFLKRVKIAPIPSPSIVPSLLKNTPTHIATNATIIPSSTASILPQDLTEIVKLPDFPSLLSEFTSSPIPTFHKYFQLPENFAEAITIALIGVVIGAVFLYAGWIALQVLTDWVLGRKKLVPIQVLDVAVFNGFKPEWRIPNADWFRRAKAKFHLHNDEVKFLKTISSRAGIGVTHYSPGIVKWPLDVGFAMCRLEAEIVMYHCVDKLLAQNNIKPEDIDIVVTNCSLFNPTPSMASMIVNHYKLRPDVQSFHLGGMGCGISPLSVNVASSCLRLHPKKHPIAIVVSMEVITPNIYLGRERAFMLQNALFRIGGAGILLTRDQAPVLGRPMPKWTIEHSSHIHTAANTDAYTCVFQDIDREERQGVRLDKALMGVAAGAITKNLLNVGPKILPLHAMIDYGVRFAAHFVRTKINAFLGKKVDVKEKMVVPNFRLAVQHFCIHAGGRAVLTAIQDSLNLTDADMKPSRDTLYKYGNTSSSSIWYEYNQVEMTRQPRKGDVMLLVAVGSGFKANLLCLRALTNIKTAPKVHEEDKW